MRHAWCTHPGGLCRVRALLLHARWRASHLRGLPGDQHDEADRGRKLSFPLLVLWGANTTKRFGWQTGNQLDMLATWRERATDVRGHGLDCGHFLPEERPEEVIAGLLAFFGGIGR